MSISQKIKDGAKAKPVVSKVTDKQHQETVELLRGRTMEMGFTVHGLPKNRKISGKLGDQVAASVAGRKKGIRASWSMFTSDHPAVKEFNGLVRELEQLRETWTIVRSAEVRKGDNEKVTIEGGKRLIWDKDIPEFHNLFTAKAKQIDTAVEHLQYAMDNTTTTADGDIIPSVKAMDKSNAGEAWDPLAYPKDLTLVVGVSKERNLDGSERVDASGEPIYVITFSEYHVSEKLPKLLQERAIQRIDEGLSSTIETAMTYAAGELTDHMMTFLGELTVRKKVYPDANGEYWHLREGELIKLATDKDDAKVPKGHVKGLIRYTEPDNSEKLNVWVGPMKAEKFTEVMQPQVSGEKKKIYPSVIENIILQLQAFREKKAKMLGPYGENVCKTFEPLLKTMLAAKEINPYVSVSEASKKLSSVLKVDGAAKEAMSKTIIATVEALAEQISSVKTTHAKRRSIKASLIGKL